MEVIKTILLDGKLDAFKFKGAFIKLACNVYFGDDLNKNFFVGNKRRIVFFLTEEEYIIN